MIILTINFENEATEIKESPRLLYSTDSVTRNKLFCLRSEDFLQKNLFANMRQMDKIGNLERCS